MSSRSNKKNDEARETNTQLVKKKTRTRRKKPAKPENDVLFFKIWRNKVLNDAIYGRVRLIKHIRIHETKFTVGSLQKYSHRDYLKKVILINDKDNRPDLSIPLSLPLPLPAGLIPVTTECLNLNNYCLINQDDIHGNVVNIEFGKSFRSINFSHIPKSVKKIQFSHYTNVTIPNDGEGLEEYKNLEFITIDVGSIFLLDYLHKFNMLKKLCINGSDGRELVIPEGITVIIFGSTFNSNLPKIYPQSLKCIRIGIEFSKIFNIHSLPLDIENLFIRSHRTHNRFNEFFNLKKLKVLQFNSGRPHEKLEGIVVSDSLPNIEEIYQNNLYKFKNNNGTLILDTSYDKNSKQKNQQELPPTNQQQNQHNQSSTN